MSIDTHETSYDLDYFGLDCATNSSCQDINAIIHHVSKTEIECYGTSACENAELYIVTFFLVEIFVTQKNVHFFHLRNFFQRQKKLIV